MINRRQATGLILGGLSLITVASSLVPPAVSGSSSPVPVKTGKILPDLFLGDPGAPATIVEYGSFTCVHCGHFTRDVMPAIKTELLDTRKARYALREVYANKRDLWAGLLAHEVSRGRTDPAAYYAFTDRLMLTQDDWAFGTSSDEDALVKLKAMAVESGLFAETADAAVHDQQLTERLVRGFAAAVKEDGVTGTPRVLVPGRPTGASLDEIRVALSA